MKIIFTFILFFVIFNSSISIVPTWNFDSSSIDLLASGTLEYKVRTDGFWGKREGNYALYKKLYKENGIVKQKNTLIIDESINFTVDYDDVESAYRNEQYVFICPRGKFYVQKYDLNEKKAYNLTKEYDGDFNENEYWDLKCFHMYFENVLMIGYLNSHNFFYSYDFKNNEFREINNIENGIYSYYMSVYGYDDNQPNKKKMFAVVKNSGYVQLKELIFVVSLGQGYYWYSENKKINLVQHKEKTFSISPISYTYFYFINYNDKYDFESGYLIQNITSIDDSPKFTIYTYKTPFEFLDDIDIYETKYIYETRFVYYKLYNNNKKNFFNGVYDTVSNKIIFNTDKEITEFKPLTFESNFNSMLAITKESAYKVCLFGKNNNNCLDECSSGNFILDAETHNHCDSECKTEYILKPNNICINSCDESIFIIKNNECWLCKDLDKDKPFKLINIPESVCLSNMPENSGYVNKQLYLIKCNDGTSYNSESNKCLYCHENCVQCTESSKNDNDQKCITCKNKEYFLYKGNCVEKCDKGFFTKDKKCEKCNDDICEDCEFESGNCTICREGKYLEKEENFQTCKDCSINCQTCSKGQENGYDNCETCNISSDFKYLFNTSCVEKCPENMTDKNYICYYEKIDDNDDNENDKIMLTIFIIICGVLLLFILVLFYKRHCHILKEDEKFMREIDTELMIK